MVRKTASGKEEKYEKRRSKAKVLLFLLYRSPVGLKNKLGSVSGEK